MNAFFDPSARQSRRIDSLPATDALHHALKTAGPVGKARNDKTGAAHALGMPVPTARKAPTPQPAALADEIFIPVEARGTPLPTPPDISARLNHVLTWKELRTFGDLHGLKVSDFAQSRNCGKKSLLELLEVIRAVQSSAASATGSQQETSEPPCETYRLAVSPVARGLDAYTLPFSPRAEHVLQSLGVRYLGELDGFPIDQLFHVRNCGPITVGEILDLLRRAGAGDFYISSDTLQRCTPNELLMEIDEMVCRLQPRDQEILKRRFGGNGQPPATLLEIGTPLRITRERVRQIVRKHVKKFARHRGPRTRAFLDKISSTCHENVIPLTAPLLRKWAAGRWTLRLQPEFYVRTIAQLRPDIPAWPEGQQYRPTEDESLTKISRALQAWLQKCGGSRPLREALQGVRATPGCKRTTVGEFLLMLKISRVLRVDFKEPHRPEVCLKSRRRRGARD